jgi:glucuronate isomerase
VDRESVYSDKSLGSQLVAIERKSIQTMLIHPDRLFPAERNTREVARAVYEHVRKLPIVSPHGHTKAEWFARNEPFPDPAQLLVQPDHYICRMLYSQGVSLEDLEIGYREQRSPRKVWQIFAEHYHLFRGTPTRIWLDQTFEEVFGLSEPLNKATADLYFDAISAKLQLPEFLPRALYERFNIEVLATTDSPIDSLEHHKAVREAKWIGRLVPTFRPDPVVDPDHPSFLKNLDTLADKSGKEVASWQGYLAALQTMRERFQQLGCTATDHGHPTAATADLPEHEAAALYARIITGQADASERELFRAQMLTEMARMSLEDGFVMQIHPGSARNHNRALYERFGPDVGADIPTPTNYVEGLRPLLNRFGNEKKLTIILFTLDESTYSRELAPLAGHYPCLRLGPPWWFHDSPEGMMRYRRSVTETAGFYNTVGFNDDTRAFLSIPARHDVARRMDAGYLAKLVVQHQLQEDEAMQIAGELAYSLVKEAYRF